jgi:hypothetical protein
MESGLFPFSSETLPHQLIISVCRLTPLESTFYLFRLLLFSLITFFIYIKDDESCVQSIKEYSPPFKMKKVECSIITRPMQTANTGGDANSVHANAQRL